jgi:hypothetical protein
VSFSLPAMQILDILSLLFSDMLQKCTSVLILRNEVSTEYCLQ